MLNQLLDMLFNREALYIRSGDGSEISIKRRELYNAYAMDKIMFLWSITLDAPYENGSDESFTSVGDSLTAQDLIDDALDFGGQDAGDDKDD